MIDFIELFNPEHLEYFTPDILIGLFGFALVIDLIGAVIDTFFRRK